MSRLENFLDEQNRLTAFPAKRRVKLQALCYVLLNQWHTFEDPATLRRELYQHRFLGRQPSGAAYWLEPQQPTLEELQRKYG